MDITWQVTGRDFWNPINLYTLYKQYKYSLHFLISLAAQPLILSSPSQPIYPKNAR
jgi:hypothetical protein